MVFDSVDDAVELVSMKAVGGIGIAGKRKRAAADEDQERARKSAERSAAEIAETPAAKIAERIAQEEFHF
jgi:hypothetical protein